MTFSPIPASATPSRHTPIPVTLLAGDGIGPEITAAFLTVFAAFDHPLQWETQAIGKGAYERFGDPLPAATLASIERTRLAIKGPVETPLGSGFRSPLIRLREHFDLFANLRPAHSLLPDNRFGQLDLVVVRENTEGLYASQESYEAVGDDPHGIARATCANSRAGCERILRFAFDYAIAHGRRQVTVVHKANVLKALSGIFLDTARRLYAAEYAGRLVMEEMIVDACAMKLVMAPAHFDVLVSTNLFGDILSDLTAGLTGGLGLAPGANIGRDAALFEAVHGSAPDIAGQGIANPIALLLAGAMLLDHVGESASAERLRQAIDLTVNHDGIRTPDLGGTADTQQLSAAIAARMAAGAA